MPSSKPDNRKPPQLGSDDLVPFDHVAAGHDGVRCTLSGSLIAKPCTRQEVEFYESSALHPGFQEFMPLFIGSLSSAEQQQPLAIAAAQQSGAAFLPALGDATTTDPVPEAPASQTSTVVQEQEAAKSTESAWVPSGGKKLDTGLSIVLENVASGFRRPNVLDVKLGARLWADDAPPTKRSKLDAVAKETTSSSLGYRIAGMKVWTGKNGDTDEGSLTDPYATKHEGKEGAKGEVIEKDGYRRYDKWYGRSFTDESIKQGFETFLAGAKAGTVDRSRMIAQRLVEELRNVQQVLESEESRMYSSSVLIVYEGDPEAMEHALEEEKKIADLRDQNGEEEDDQDDDEEEVEFEINEESLELVDVQLGDGLPQTAININIDPSTAQFPTLGDDDEDEEDAPKVHDLRLIDFAHATWTPGAGPDENVLMGIRSLIKMFQELAA
ncbi:arginine metabolism regulation protein iii [Penicillium brasilianum]|uniref:Kinase n=1 Tax=Penicillium brasilianum TaxID=104259 RepID=A0A1S9RVD9_PENBI|nr:arginine metabolism regulation protein iii [Penicillium brasilianum]